ncbi:unknown [Prevotella sp. CAG:873]|nr:unknown [Prevotella sp. CAG:873]
MDGNGVGIGLAGLESGLHGGIVDVRLCSNYGLEFQRSCQHLGDDEGVISDDIIGHIGSVRRVYQRPFDGTAGGSNCAGGEVEGAVMDEAVDVMAADSDVRGCETVAGLELDHQTRHYVAESGGAGERQYGAILGGYGAGSVDEVYAFLLLASHLVAGIDLGIVPGRTAFVGSICTECYILGAFEVYRGGVGGELGNITCRGSGVGYVFVLVLHLDVAGDGEYADVIGFPCRA